MTGDRGTRAGGAGEGEGGDRADRRINSPGQAAPPAGYKGSGQEQEDAGEHSEEGYHRDSERAGGNVGEINELMVKG